MTEPDGWRELVELERPAAFDPETGRLLAPIGPGWWHIVGDNEDRLLDVDAARALLEPGGWTLTGALGVLLYAREDDDDEAMARTRRHLEAFERRYWPVLAALAHELGPEDRPSTGASTWLDVTTPKQVLPESCGDVGKWCIFRDSATVDDAWHLVRAAVLMGRLYSAKVSGAARAAKYGGVHVICVYCPDSTNLAAVREARAILRELGFVEELGYKTDCVTRQRLTGDAEWLIRE